MQFNNIPTTLRVPFNYIEFDSSKAQKGPVVFRYKMLVLGQKTSSGTAAVNTFLRITSTDQAKVLFGRGSHLATMIEAIFRNQKTVEVWAACVTDAGGATAASGTLTFTGTPTETASYAFYIGGRRHEIVATPASTPTTLAAALVASVTADVDGFVTAANVAGVVTFTAKNLGLLGNKIDLRENYFAGEKNPAGLTTAIVAMASGATNPTLTTLIAALPETQYNFVVCPWIDATNLGALNTEFDDRFGPVRQLDGVVIAADVNTLGNLSTLGVTYNKQCLSIVGGLGPTPPWIWAATAAAQVAQSGQSDPGRPMQTLSLTGVLAPSETEKFSTTEQNSLLYSGFATHQVASDGTVQIQRMITTYKTNASGSADTSYLDIMSGMILSYLRYDFRTRMALKYGRHKLADNGIQFPAGSYIITPAIGKAEAINFFQDWQNLGLVENADQFARDLVVERNATDPNRLDFLLPADLINSLMIAAAQFQFRL